MTPQTLTSSAASVEPVPTAIATALAAGVSPDRDGLSLARARAFAEPLLAGETLDTGEGTLAHADAVVEILQRIGGTAEMQACVYLVYACQHLNRPREVIAKAFGADFADVALETTKLVQLQRQARVKAAEVRAPRQAA
mgnify:CR=1 FL=1